MSMRIFSPRFLYDGCNTIVRYCPGQEGASERAETRAAMHLLRSQPPSQLPNAGVSLIAVQYIQTEAIPLNNGTIG